MPLRYLEQQPAVELKPYVDSYWWIGNESDEPLEVIVLPDGRIDASFRPRAAEFTLHGLETAPGKGFIPAHTEIFSISFKPCALESLFSKELPLRPDSIIRLPAETLISQESFEGFDDFVTVAQASLMNKRMSLDEQKQQLFETLYQTRGEIRVHELAAAIHWPERQINRYFQQLIGMPAKTFASILRFRAAFDQLKAGKLYPEQEFSDQSHFIRQIKKFSGVTPKVLSENQNDRFIQFSTLR